MPRPRKEYVRLTGRVIADGGSTLEEVNFVKNKLKVMDQSTLVRQAISIYYKYENGQLINNLLEQKLEEITTKFISALKGMKTEDINEILKKEDAISQEDKKEELSPKEKELMNKMKRDLLFGFGMLKDD